MHPGLILLLVGFAFFMGYTVGRQNRPPAKQMVRFINRSTPTTLDFRERHEILQLLQNKQKIQAIKRYRELTSASLKDSKEAIEQLEAEFY